MKIGIITNLYPPYLRGGAEHVIVRTVEALLDLDHDVFVVSSRPKGKWGHRLVFDKTTTERVYRFFPRNLYYILDDHKHSWLVRLAWHVIDTFYPYGPRKIRKVLAEENPEVLITHNLKGIGLSIPRFIQKRGIPHVHVVHDLQLIYPSGLLFSGLEKIPRYRQPFYSIYQKICQRQLGRPDLVIFPSSYLKSEYIKLGFFQDTDVVVMPNPAPRFSLVKRELKLDGPVKLLFVGQLEEHKGIRFLLDAFRDLDIDARLIIAGEGTCVDLVQHRAENDKRITYLGYISLDQLLNCFSISDALVVPSLCYENSPTVIYESLQSGVPVLASDIGGVGELVQDERNGFLFQPGSKTAFLAAVKKFADRRIAFAASPEAIQSTIAPYALDNYTQALLAKLQKVIDDKQIR
ncbi:glycosyltransferase [Patescibacteria group bacterium]|nr:glycosyltransferase [Patescibacteria group bacterium]